MPLLNPTNTEKMLLLPLNKACPLNSVVVEIRSISDRNATNSWSKYDRSVVPTVPPAAWVANSRIRPNKLPMDAAPPSAVCVKLMPSPAFRVA